MSILVNVGPEGYVEAGLKERLARAAKNDPARCSPRIGRVTGKVRSNPQFMRTLRRAKALAEENRLLAIFLLKDHRELCACEIQAGLGLTHATVSHHMAVLAKAGLVDAERRGKWMYYTLNGNGEVSIT